jgi:hypothetical protein
MYKRTGAKVDGWVEHGFRKNKWRYCFSSYNPKIVAYLGDSMTVEEREADDPLRDKLKRGKDNTRICEPTRENNRRRLIEEGRERRIKKNKSISACCEIDAIRWTNKVNRDSIYFLTRALLAIQSCFICRKVSEQVSLFVNGPSA